MSTLYELWPYAFLVFLAVVLVQSRAPVLAMACVQHRVKSGTPVRLLRFLDDARGRHVLRTVGPAYQLRHARLQDRLAHPVPFHSK